MGGAAGENQERQTEGERGIDDKEEGMTLFIWAYGIALVAGAAFVIHRPDFVGNVGFLILGAAASIYPGFLIEHLRRRRDTKTLARAIHCELANRVARCCFDFESPWKALLTQQTDMPAFRLRKFTPEPPIIYPAAAAQIAMLEGAASAIIEFYIFLAAWRRDIENTVKEMEGSRANQSQLSPLAKRLRQTLRPGLDALQALRGQVPNAEQVERDAIAGLDRLSKDHPNKGKSLRERIEIALSETEQSAA